jgi:nucleotide-binding universal stress UspA family protein
MEFKHILVPIDFSEFSDKAVEFALHLAARYQAKIALAHVVVMYPDDIDEETRFQEYQEFINKREARVQEQIQSRQDRAASRKIPVDSVLLRGFSPADALLEYIKEKKFDLVIMGTHGRTGLKHFIQGSVAEKMLRLAPIPVLAVHRSIRKYDIGKIVVPVDFSAHSRRAVDFAANIARRHNAKILFFHVIEQEIYPSAYGYDNEPIPAFDRNLHQIVLKNLREFVVDGVDDSLVEDYVVKEGPAHKEIVDFANERKADLLVMATHGLTGIEYVLLGSTAEKVTRFATCPVLTVKGKGY